MPDLEDRIKNLEASADATKTEFDAITGRLTALENTVSAMGDTLKNFAPDNLVDVGGAISDIKAGVNKMSVKIFGDVAFPEPTPEPTV